MLSPDIVLGAHGTLWSAALLKSTENVTSHWADLTIRIVLYNLFQLLRRLIYPTLVEQAQSFYEQELGTMGTMGETLGRELHIGSHFLLTFLTESLISSSIERIF